MVEYLKNTTYTEDVYSILVLGQLINQTQEEIKQHKNDAIDKLSMIRNHLVHKANGDFELAAIDDNILKRNVEKCMEKKGATNIRKASDYNVK
ncbi:hypothetical protein HPULCUR_002459 [Helicostylum pulchrum]|uniref:Uncharacterized protein n=1 Tax=Helicostylum pulchrum TaxID=562976 RepID=A0ABP9XRT8_9FUNG